MKTFDSLHTLNESFTQGLFEQIPEEIKIKEMTFVRKATSPFTLSNDVTPVVMYVSESTKGHLFLVWRRNGLSFTPALVTQSQGSDCDYVLKLKEAQIDDDRIISHKVQIILSGFNGNKAITAKVDTGAEMSSLDANDISWNKGSNVVTFTFGDKRVTMSLVDQQGVKTADGGVEYRPVVEFDVQVPTSDNKTRAVKRVRFNLNDRTGMPDKILLGQNFIKAGNFVVMNNSEEPKDITSEEVDWDSVDSISRQLLEQTNNARIAEVYEQLLRANISLSDLVRYMKSEAIKAL